MWDGHRVPRSSCLRNPSSRGRRCPSHTRQRRQAKRGRHPGFGDSSGLASECGRHLRPSANCLPTISVVIPARLHGPGGSRRRGAPATKCGPFPRSRSILLRASGAHSRPANPPHSARQMWETSEAVCQLSGDLLGCGSGTVCRDSPAQERLRSIFMAGPSTVPRRGQGPRAERDVPAFGTPGVAAHGAPPTFKNPPRRAISPDTDVGSQQNWLRRDHSRN